MKILDNGIAVLEVDSHISMWVQETGRLDHDQNLLPVILPYIKPGDWVIDAGANIGDHTFAYLKATGSSGVVLAFEPNPNAFQCLKHNCPTALAYPFGLSHKTGMMDFVPMDNAGASFLQPGIGTVFVLALDSVHVPRLNFFKLDIEGMEMDALLGSEKTILRTKPIILIEVNSFALDRNKTSPKGLIEYIESLGYEKKKVYESDNFDAPQYDLLFLPRKDS